MKKKLTLKNVIILYAFLLVVWGFYRLIFQLPGEVEELLIKPLIWLVPTAFLVFKVEKNDLKSLGITTKNLFPAIYYAVALGALFAVEAAILNYIKHGGFNFSANLGNQVFLIAIGLSFATGITEEITFRGYMFNRIFSSSGNEWSANLITTVAWTAIHLPVQIFVLKLSIAGIATRLFLTFLFGAGSAFVFARTKNVGSSILLHVLWEWPIILFR